MKNEECEWRDSAWAFVLGSASDDEVDQFKEHLFGGCASCGHELARAREVIADLDMAVCRRTVAQGHGSLPNESVREQLLANLSTRTGQLRAAPADQEAAGRSAASAPVAEPLHPTSIPGVGVVPDADGTWQATPVEGVEVRTLLESPDRHVYTALVRMAPGSSYPAHRHSVPEECYVISGDLSFSGHTMRAGDYQFAEEGSVHTEQSTEEGCLLLVIAGWEDEVL